MAIAPRIETYHDQPLDGYNSEGLAEVVSLTSSYTEDLDISQEINNANPVINQEPQKLSPDYSHSIYGRAIAQIVTFENGRKQEVVTGIPKHQKSDIPITMGTALGTSIYGHNWLNMWDMMNLGYPVVLIGPEGGKADWPKNAAETIRLFRHLASISLTETARNMHEVLNVTDRDQIYKPGKVIQVGESRAAAAGLGFHAMAGEFHREVIYGDYTAACFPQKLKEAKEYLALPRQALHQTGRLIQAPLRKPWERAKHYPKTINPNPFFLMHVAATLPTLLSGTAGKMAREIPGDSKIHNTGFEQDPWSDLDVWEHIFANYTHAVNTRLPGDHSSLADEDVLAARLDRLRGLRDELVANHQKPEKITWENVHMGGRLAVVAA